MTRIQPPFASTKIRNNIVENQHFLHLLKKVSPVKVINRFLFILIHTTHLSRLSLTALGLIRLGEMGRQGSSTSPGSSSMERYSAVKYCRGTPPSPPTSHSTSPRIVDRCTVTFTSGGGRAKNKEMHTNFVNKYKLV